MVSYLDGNSLGRPLKATRERLLDFVDGAWGSRLIRAWDEGWMDDPVRVGDDIGRIVLGAAAGQTVVGDSTTVMLYKWIRAALGLTSGRKEIVLDSGNFPTDRFVLEGVAAEHGLTLRWVHPDPAGGVEPEELSQALGERTALVVLSNVAYRSGHLADVPAITEAAHAVGAPVLWDVCHSAGVVEMRLDEWGVDLAVGCSYKYLNGGPGAPAFGYVRRDLQDRLRQPIQGWMGAAEPFAMADRYQPAPGIRRFVSGTPPILGMLPLQDMLALIDRAGVAAIRSKSLALTGYAVEYHDALLAPLGVRLGSPRDPARRGSHVTLEHPDFRSVTERAWQRGVIPDFRPPDGLRVGLSPLSTSFAEVHAGLGAVHDLLVATERLEESGPVGLRAARPVSPPSAALDDQDFRPGSATSLLRTVIGLHLRGLGGWIAAAALLHLLGELGLAPSRARTAIARVGGKGVLEPERRAGAAGYRLSARALPMLERGDRRIFGSPDLAAGGRWCLVSFSIPESQRALRHQLRRRLSWTGCGLVAAGLWICPDHRTADVEQILDDLGVGEAAAIFLADETRVADGLPAAVARWWDLPGIAEHHRAFLAVAERLDTVGGPADSGAGLLRLGHLRRHLAGHPVRRPRSAGRLAAPGLARTPQRARLPPAA